MMSFDTNIVVHSANEDSDQFAGARDFHALGFRRVWNPLGQIP